MGPGPVEKKGDRLVRLTPLTDEGGFGGTRCLAPKVQETAGNYGHPAISTCPKPSRCDKYAHSDYSWGFHDSETISEPACKEAEPLT